MHHNTFRKWSKDTECDLASQALKSFVLHVYTELEYTLLVLLMDDLIKTLSH